MTTIREGRSEIAEAQRTSEGQTYLVGESVYLRSVTPADAEFASAWKDTLFPQAPERVRSWIEDDFTKNSNPYRVNTLLIVRKRDDRPVGSVRTDYRGFPHHDVYAHVDPLSGEEGLTWKAEALAMVLPWIVDDQQRPKAGVRIPAYESPVIDAIEAIGARATARFREKLALPGGGRADELTYEYLNRSWVSRLGDPADETFPRTGTGVARPVSAPVQPDGDPPANAMRIGPRVYLRPPQKSDAEAFAYWSARENDASWDNGRQPFSVCAASDWFENFQRTSPPRVIDFAVCLRETDEFLGLVGVLGPNYHHRFGESASMIVNPSYREAGYGSEAKHLMFDYVFNTVGLHALQSYVMFENPRSAAALRKQGYREAGRDHWVMMRDGSFVSFTCFDLLASDWRAMPRNHADSD
ncbi:MAG TPA: GNAT family protein [Thermomicrobiales bacterium]|nr:GNAT family protein [Thermomicrobiales bacterium]